MVKDPGCEGPGSVHYPGSEDGAEDDASVSGNIKGEEVERVAM